jgi:alkanesulfonate monooxygenase SsuD/methylene tetrahydromethanopterin reductase-like flavin-dependent oxidoreductase (luciferase family)
MTGRPSKYGLCVPIFAHPGASFFRAPNWTELDPAVVVDAAQLAERLGYDSLWVADHLIHGKDGGILEGWTTLSFLAGRTRRISLGTIHLAHLFRPPALTAKMAATLDALSGGRLIFFYDTRASNPEEIAYGFDATPLAERIASMDEGLDLIRRLWTTEGPVDFAGTYYHLQGAICQPKPVQRPTPPIWLGEMRDDSWADLIWKHATGWNSVPATVEGYAAKLEQLGAAAKRAGRDLGELELSLEIEVLVAPTRAEVRRIADQIAALPAAGPARPNADLLAHLKSSDPAREHHLTPGFESRALVGTPDEVVDRIRQYQGLGVRHLMLWFLDFPSPEGIELFASDVLPHVKVIPPGGGSRGG